MDMGRLALKSLSAVYPSSFYAPSLRTRFVCSPDTQQVHDHDYLEGLNQLESGRLVAAVELFKAAGSRGDAGANFYLALAYDGLIGTGARDEFPIEPNAEAAARCYTRAAEDGHAEAMLNLSFCFREGEGVGKDVSVAFDWLKRAADAGNDRAQFNAAVALDPLHPPYGSPAQSDPARAMIPKDPVAALGFYRQAAAQEHAKAMVNLGVVLYTGSGCGKDKAAAKELWLRAHEKGVEQASFCLRNMEDSDGEFKNMF